jgi:glutathione S-transferase
MKLHYHPVSMTSRPLMFFLEDNGIDCDMEVVDLMTGAHMKAPFTDINPNKLVPVLEDGDFVLTESSAIFKYIADKQGLESLYPKDLKARARVNERMDWFNTQFYREYGYHLVYPQIFDHHKRPDETSQKVTLEWGKERAAQSLQVLNDHILGDNPYVCGSEPTIADYFGVGLITAGEHIKVDFGKYPKVQAWIERMKGKSDAWAKTHDVHEGFRASLAEKSFVTI